MAVSVKIEQFEGPLDLLLHLVQINKYDIFDIPIVEITDQYMTALGKMQSFDMEVATEFLLMAATLLQWKSRMLLPAPPKSEEEEENTDPRQLLMEMLVEYRKIKLKAAALGELKQAADKMLARMPLYSKAALTLPGYTLKDLLLALAQLAEDQGQELAYIEPQAFSVEEKMEEMLGRLRQAGGGVMLSDFFQVGNRAEKVASFLGLLELLKSGQVLIEQGVAFGPIYIFVRAGEKNGV